MKNILIVDDDSHIGDLLEELLEQAGYNALRAYSGTETLLVLTHTKPDLILLDLMLPGLTGEEVLKKIKDIPVIVISAKMDIDSKVDLLMGGAVDYVTKPFNGKELLARIDVQLRGRHPSIEATSLRFDDLTINLLTRRSAVGDFDLRLTKTEFAILKTLMQNPSQVITKSLMLERISSDTLDCTESSLKMHISNLRKKIREANGKDYIEAVWGIGFKLRTE